jgi:hypothetical protein
MKLRNRLLPVGALVVAVGASAAGAATAAEGGKGDKPKSDPAIVKCEGKVGGEKDKGDKAGKADKGDKGGDEKSKGDKGSGPVQKQEPDWDAVAGQLGVTAQQLEDALRATKIWIGEGESPTPDMFVQHVADLLHQPVAKVKAALEGAGVFRDDGGGKDKNSDKKPDQSPDQSDKRDKSSDQNDKGDKGDKGSDKSSDKATDKSSDKSTDKAGDKAGDQDTDQSPDKPADPDSAEK